MQCCCGSMAWFAAAEVAWGSRVFVVAFRERCL